MKTHYIVLTLAFFVSSVASFCELIPGPLKVHIQTAPENKPAYAATVRVGGRFANTDRRGNVVFNGLPEGSYRITCDFPGHDNFVDSYTFPNGEREPITITLSPEIKAPLRLIFQDSATNQAPGDIRIKMTPLKLRKYFKEPVLINADFNGKIDSAPLPSGQYEMEVASPGFHKLTRTYTHKKTKDPVIIKLDPIISKMPYTIQVHDNSGKTISGAKVSLWEAYPGYHVVSGTSNASGSVSFELTTGLFNPAGEDENLIGTCRSELVARVEADSFLTRMQSVRITRNGSVDIILQPVREVTEIEPNDSKGNATEFVPGQKLIYQIEDKSDQDWFAFTLDEPAQVKIAAPEEEIEREINLYDNAGNRIRRLCLYRRRDGEIISNLNAGHYSLQVNEWGMNNASTVPLNLRTSVIPICDSLEPNNTTASKQVIPGNRMRGFIFPEHDIDTFSLKLDRPCRLLLKALNAPALERTVSVFDRNGKEQGKMNLYRKRDGQTEMQMKAGEYTVTVAEWGNNGCCLEPYDFLFLTVADDMVDDDDWKPGKQMSPPRRLKIGQRVFANITPVGDHDAYTINVPTEGVLLVKQYSPVELATSLYDLAGNRLGGGKTYSGRELQWHCHFDKAKTTVLHVGEWGNNGWHPMPYLIETWFHPASETEILQNNDTRETATPIELGCEVRESIQPLHDQDWFTFVIDKPGRLIYSQFAAVELHATFYNAENKNIATVKTYRQRTGKTNLALVPGIYFLHIQEWGNNGSAPEEYHFTTKFQRALPGETVPLNAGPLTQLKLNEARQYCLENTADLERFRISIPAEGDYSLYCGGPLEKNITVIDIRTGKELFVHKGYGGRTDQRGFTLEGPTELQLKVMEWGNNGWNMTPNWIMVGNPKAPFIGGHLEWKLNPTNPTEVTFKARTTRGMPTLKTPLQIDCNLDGTPDLTIANEQEKIWNFPSQGVYRISFKTKNDSVTAHGEYYVQASGQPIRKGTRVLITSPGENETISDNIPVSVTAMNFEGKTITRVSLFESRSLLGTDLTAPYEFEIDWRKFAGRNPALRAIAFDSSGNRTEAARNISVSDYFDLKPENGSVVTGKQVTVSWSGNAFGTGKVRYRSKNTENSPWQTVTGRNGRNRRIVITDMEAGKTYEFQPLGGSEPGPIREITRIKGLAFSSSNFGGTIQRDYDQKLEIGVQNNAEEARTVRLRCDQPNNSKLLTEFIGDGEKGRPVDLGPGEHRTFMLGFSAQDVVKEEHILPIYIKSEDGFSDQAQVTVRVKLPEVKLEWRDLTSESEKDRLGRTLELINNGDTLTDLDIRSENGTIRISPEVKHGLLKRGQQMRFEVYPQLFEGFTGYEDTIIASSVDKHISIPVAGKLKPGDAIYLIDFTPGLDPVTEEADSRESAIRAARKIVGKYLDPEHISWNERTNPEDTDNDGQVDTWQVDDEINQTLWYGIDTNKDGEVDQAKADIGYDGEIDHVSMLNDGTWESTNVLDVWLEMNFTIPKNRNQYQPHDLDITLNNTVVGSLRNTIPEGNYRFRLPQNALNWQGGKVAQNQLGINSKFLNYAHYAINSDFQFKARMLDASLYAVGASREDAVNRLFDNDKELTISDPDYSISSEDLRFTPSSKLSKGTPVIISGILRNLGSGKDDYVQLGLFLAVPGTKGLQLARHTVEGPGMTEETPFEFEWIASPGNHSLRIVADPDEETDELNRKNNAAIVSISVPGDDTPPTLNIIHPEDNLKIDENQVTLRAEAEDDTGIAGIAVSIDNGPFTDLVRTGLTWSGVAQLQPGNHKITFRAMDSGAKTVTQSRSVSVAGHNPELSVISPKDSDQIDSEKIVIKATAGDNVEKMAARVNNGPWYELRKKADEWVGPLEISFGQCNIDVVAVNQNGFRSSRKVGVRCTAQPKKEDTENGDGEEDQEEESESEKAKKETADQEKSETDQPTTEKPESRQQNQDKQTAENVTKEKPQAARDSDQPKSKKKKAHPKTPPSGSTKTARNNQNTPENPSEKETPETEQIADSDTPVPADIPDTDTVIPPPGYDSPQQLPTQTRPGAPSHSRARSRRPNSTGGGITVNRNRHDWYCPNRPKIDVKFGLPDWLTKEEFDKILAEGPNSTKFKELEAKLLASIWYKNFGRKVRGKTMDKLLSDYRDMLLKRCGRLDQADGKLPDFLQSLGFKAMDPPTDPAKMAEWRQKMKDLTNIYWMRLLATEDPANILKGMQKRGKALSKYDEGAMMAAEAVCDEIKANQEFAEECIEALPYAGEVLDVYALVTGETALSGRQVDAIEWVMRAGGLGISAYGKRAEVREFMEKFSGAYKHGGEAFKDALAKKFAKAGKKLDPDALEKICSAINAAKKKGTQAAKTKLDDIADSAGSAFKHSDEGKKALLRKAQDEKNARELIEKLKKANDPDEIADLTRKIQHDKTAQRLINDDSVDQVIRDKAIDYLDDPASGKGLYQRTDKKVKKLFNDALTGDADKLKKISGEVGAPSSKQLKELQDEAASYAKKHGVDVDDLEVEVVAPTNKKTGKRTMGRDRDVTYQIKVKDDVAKQKGLTRTKPMDINHDMSDSVYKKNFWEEAHPGKSLDNMDEAHKFADGMDQMVTSAKHPEAYDIGELTVQEFFEGGLGNVSVTGKKQAVKQNKKAVLARVQKYGLDPETALSPKLRKGMEIFDDVASGRMPLEQGEHMLKKIGMSKDAVVNEMANTFRKIETSGPAKIFRDKGEKQLKKIITRLNQEQSLDATVSALKNGKISGEAFKTIRSQITGELAKSATPKQIGRLAATKTISKLEYNSLLKSLARRTGRSIDEIRKEAEEN